jgi:hypothetical protein
MYVWEMSDEGTERKRRDRLRTQSATSLAEVVRHHMSTSNSLLLAVGLQVFLTAEVFEIPVIALASSVALQ